MPKNTKEFISEIIDLMRVEETHIITMPWPDFYKRAELERFRDERAESISDEGKKNGVIVGYGANVVAFVRDINFSPAK